MGFFAPPSSTATLTVVTADRRGRAEQPTSFGMQTLYDNIEVELDVEAPILWCWMRPAGKPIVTDELLFDLKTLYRQLPEILDGVAHHPIKYYVLASRAPQTYSLGGDLALFAECVRSGNRSAVHTYAHRCIDVIAQHVVAFNQPLITLALVQGDALGGGFETALSCDVIVAERGAKMGLPEILFNLFPGMGAYSFLSRRLSPAAAMRMIQDGSVHTAEALHDMGVVDVLADRGEGVSAVREYVKKNGRHHNALTALHQARRSAHPITERELRDIVNIWVDAVFRLTADDLRRMGRLTAAQERRRLNSRPQMLAAE